MADPAETDDYDASSDVDADDGQDWDELPVMPEPTAEPVADYVLDPVICVCCGRPADSPYLSDGHDAALIQELRSAYQAAETLSVMLDDGSIIECGAISLAARVLPMAALAEIRRPGVRLGTIVRFRDEPGGQVLLGRVSDVDSTGSVTAVSFYRGTAPATLADPQLVR